MNEDADPRRLVIIAGPNGSGKSSVTRGEELARAGISLPTQYINADDIARAFRDDKIILSSEEIERKAFREARNLRKTYREQKIPFAFETVFSHPSTLLDIQKCRASGYHVVLIYVTTSSVEINLGRVEGRVKQGGHNVPPDRIRSRYIRSLSLLPRAFEEATEAFVYDSTDRTRLCARKYPDERIRFLNLPPYLEERLRQRLVARAAERTRITEEFGKRGNIRAPDEETGKYTGSLLCAYDHYALQEIGPEYYCLHDLSLLTQPLPDNTSALFTYKDCACTPEPAPNTQ